jgi:uncharacterized protein (TIGR02757 family)
MSLSEIGEFDANRRKHIDLEEIYNREKSKLPGLIYNDPVEFVHRFEDERDQEIAGFLGSQFAYGKIDLFKRFLTGLFDRMGRSPARFVRKGDFSSFRGLYYRFQKEKDLIDLFNVLKKILDEFGSIGNMIEHFYAEDTREALWRSREHLLGDSDKLTFFFPKRLKSSPLKRWSLYLRWMVRKDRVDVGLWDFIDRKDLIIPLDTHIFKIGRCLGWTASTVQSYKAAQEITDALKRFDPQDPLKYDLFLCHVVGIGGGCTGKRSAVCEKECLLIRARRF